MPGWGFNPLQAVQDGYDFAQKTRDQQTTQRAGNALAGGDYQAAQNAFNQGGMVDQAQKIQGYQDQRSDQASLAKYRDAQAQNLTDDNQRAQVKDRLEMMGKLAVGLRKVDPTIRKQVFGSQVAPVLKGLGIPDDALAQLGQSELSDQELDVFTMSVGKELEKLTLFNTTEGIVGVNPQTGEARNLYKTERKVGGSWHEKTNPDGSTSMVWLPNDPNAGGGGGSGPSGPPGATGPSAGSQMLALLPAGSRVTSTARSPQHNAEVGGVPNSHHLDGSAIDFVPPKGVTIDQVKAKFAGAGVHLTEALDEGDHFHVAWGGAAPAPPAKGELSWDAAKPGGLNPNQARQASVALRKEFDQHPDVKQFQTVATQYGIISRLANNSPDAAGDMSMIFAYMKILDPTSVVREGEFANAQNTAGIPARIVNAYNKALSGTRLGAEQRREFAAQAGEIYSENKSRYDQLVSQYQGYAKDTGLPETTIQPRIAPTAPKKTGGQVNVPPAAVDYLKKNPATRAQFDAKYGAGASARILGK